MPGSHSLDETGALGEYEPCWRKVLTEYLEWKKVITMSELIIETILHNSFQCKIVLRSKN